MKRLEELFEIRYGTSLELNRLQEVDSGGIPFVARSTRNNGVTAQVLPLEDVPPMAPGTLTVALSGAGVLQTFLQERPYYTGFHMAVLVPRLQMTRKVLLAYALLIPQSRFRYGWGRQANKSLRFLSVPGLDELPAWVDAVNLSAVEAEIMDFEAPEASIELSSDEWKPFKLPDLFTITRGQGPSLLDAKESRGTTPYVTASEKNNGISAWTSSEAKHPGGGLTVATNGSVGECFYQPDAFAASSDVAVLMPKAPMSVEVLFFIATLVRREGKLKYGYGRKWGLQRMVESTIRLPSAEGKVDFQEIKRIVRSLPSWCAL